MTSIDVVPADQFLKLQEHIRYLEKENARTKEKIAMLAEQLHDVYKISDDMNNKDIKGKLKGDGNKEDKESEVHGTLHHRFRDQMWIEFQEFKNVTSYQANKFKA